MTHQIENFLRKLKDLSKSESIPCVGGRSDLPAQPGLLVNGRHISLPVNEKELDWLYEQGNESPFGKGMDTIIDTNIRKSIEFEAQAIEVSNPNWKPVLDQLVESIVTEMGIDFQVQAELFKLLVYRKGGHFAFHQDTEKSHGMFATLVIQLPSRCNGGSLNCRFSGKDYHFDFGNKEGDSEFSIYYAAHYADVHHQVEKIVDGSRLVLIYNLVQPEKERKLSANHHKQLLKSTTDMVMPIINLLIQEQHSFLLQHEYTEQSLSDLGFLATKGQDRDLLTALVAINDNLPLEKKLSFMISRVSYCVTSDGSCSYYDRGDIEWDEIETSEPCCDLFFDEDGQKVPVNNFMVDWIHDLSINKICSIPFDEVDDDFWGDGDDDIEGFMGNYGPTKETTYARYLLVIMPLYPDSSDNFSQDMVLQTHNILLMAKDLKNHSDSNWLQKRFDQALQKACIQFNSLVCQNEGSTHFDRNFDHKSEAIFARLLKIAIEMNDHHLCRNLINMAKPLIVAGLSSYQYERILSLLKHATNHFEWEYLSTSLQNIIKELNGTDALKLSIAFSESLDNQGMRSKLIDICVSIICSESDVWGGSCSFEATILPLAINVCKTCWYASDQVKKLFLDACLKKSVQHQSFLSALIQNLINDSRADDKKWLLQSLITTRLEYLEIELSKDLREFSWSMPNASTKKRKITDFLRSEDYQTDITGYDGIAMARKDIITVKADSILPEFYMESNADFLKNDRNCAFSATMCAKGRGKASYVEIKKDKRHYELYLKLRELREKELKRLKEKHF